MPRGVPKNGVRMTKKRVNEMANPAGVVHVVQNRVEETEEAIDLRLRERFDILEMLTQSAIYGDVRSLITSGPAGLGKSFTVDKELSTWDPNKNNHSIVKGFLRPTGLYKLLYKHRQPGQVLVFDDADEVFYDETCLNLLKAVCDTTEMRSVSWLAETNMEDDETGEKIPRWFTFEGTIIFITNLDFDGMIEKGNKLAPHMQALVSRSHYIDLTMKTRKDYFVCIKQVVKAGMLKDHGLTQDQEDEVMEYIKEKQETLRELSLRMAVKIANLVKIGNNWRKIANVTCNKVA